MVRDRELRHALLDLVLDSGKRVTVEFDEIDRGHMSVAVFFKSGKIDDVINSWNFDSEKDFFENVKLKLK